MIYLLHISDLHLVTDPQWNNMKNAILYSVREKLSHIGSGQKLLVITGDFHNFVQNDYTQAENFLPQLFDAMGIEPDKDVFVIPGNHDIFTPDPLKRGRALAIEAVRSNPHMLQTGMDDLLSSYDKYIEFVQKLGVYPSDCGRLPVHAHVRSWRNKLNILHLNTTLIADGQKGCQMVDTLAATSDDVRRQLHMGNLPRIAIGHNSYFDLLDEHRTQLSAMFLQEYVSAYLCGDKHQRNSVREKNRITLSGKLSAITIPNIVSYKSSTDEGDTYSDFGMIWHIWDEKTGRVELEFMRWDPQDQAELQPDGNDFYEFRKLKQAAASISVTDNDDSCWRRNNYILEKSKIEIKNFHVRNFLRGGRCEWNLAFSNRIVLREIVDELYDCAIDGGTYALVGPGGEGKTTILMQLCAKLISDKIPIFYYRGYGLLKFPDHIPDKAVFIIDNPSGSIKFKQFLESIIENGQTLIVGARQNEWNILKTSLMIPDRMVLEIPIQKLTAKESWRFAECMIDNLKCAMSKKDMKNLFYNNSYGFLYAAMLMIVNNKNSLEEIAYEIIKNLFERSYKALLLLAHIVLSERYGVRFIPKQFRTICSKYAISPKEANRALSREISLNGDIYQTRHNVISELFYQELFSDSGLLSLDNIDEILENLMLYYLKRYQNSYGSIESDAWNSIMLLSGGLSQTSIKTQEFLINRILDEVNLKKPSVLSKLPSYIRDEETQLLFYRQCFKREYIYPDFILKWCKLLQKNGTSGNINEPYSPAWIMRNVCIKYNGDNNTWLAWAQMEVRENRIGDYESENTARWIYREACLNHNGDGRIWRAWAQMEAGENRIGDYESENTARWIYREACLNHDGDSSIWRAWAQMEAGENRIGNYESENTTRWIYREACLNHNGDSSIWLAWAQMEAGERRIGDYESENTARWIYRKGCLNHNGESSIWLAWAQMEARERRIGDYESENTARWIYREACLHHNGESSIWLAWAQMEVGEGRIGDYESENTARWIYREACLHHNGEGSIWLAWAQMEAGEGRIGDYESENTARWIYRKGCLNHNGDSSIWLAWAQMEAGENRIGEYESENTARWIYREGCLNHDGDSSIWLAWAQMEAGERRIGEYESENTARWIYREGCLNHNGDSSIWKAWAQMEAEENQIGDYESENTARWIFTEGLTRFPEISLLYNSFANMELSMHSVDKAKSILRKSIQYDESCAGCLAILEFFCGNIDSDDSFCTKNLMKRMERTVPYSLYTLLYLYHCSILLERSEDAEKYHKQLLNNPEYDLHNKRVEYFIQLCREAIDINLS